MNDRMKIQNCHRCGSSDVEFVLENKIFGTIQCNNCYFNINLVIYAEHDKKEIKFIWENLNRGKMIPFSLAHEVKDILFRSSENYRKINWGEVKKICESNRMSTVKAGLLEDWEDGFDIVQKDGIINANIQCYDRSSWATPVIEIDGNVIPCWKKCCECESEACDDMMVIYE